MSWMEAEDKEFFKERARAFLDAHERLTTAQRDKQEAERELITQMAEAELEKIQLGGSTIALECPDDGPAYLSVSFRSVLDLGT